VLDFDGVVVVVGKLVFAELFHGLHAYSSPVHFVLYAGECNLASGLAKLSLILLPSSLASRYYEYLRLG